MLGLLKGQLERRVYGTSLVVQWLRLCTANAGDWGLIPGGGTEIPMLWGIAGKFKFKKKEESVVV